MEYNIIVIFYCSNNNLMLYSLSLIFNFTNFNIVKILNYPPTGTIRNRLAFKVIINWVILVN